MKLIDQNSLGVHSKCNIFISHPCKYAENDNTRCPRYFIITSLWEYIISELRYTTLLLCSRCINEIGLLPEEPIDRIFIKGNWWLRVTCVVAGHGQYINNLHEYDYQLLKYCHVNKNSDPRRRKMKALHGYHISIHTYLLKPYALTISVWHCRHHFILFDVLICLMIQSQCIIKCSESQTAKI